MYLLGCEEEARALVVPGLEREAEGEAVVQAEAQAEAQVEAQSEVQAGEEVGQEAAQAEEALLADMDQIKNSVILGWLTTNRTLFHKVSDLTPSVCVALIQLLETRNHLQVMRRLVR